MSLRSLVERAKDGDELAFSRLVDSIGDRLYTVAFHILGDSGLADDASQSALIQVWRELPRLRDLDRFEGWAYRIVVRAAYRESARRRRITSLPTIEVADLHDRHGFDEPGRVGTREILEHGLARLSPTHRSVLVMKHHLGLDDDEIAEVLGVPRGTVRSRLFYAMRSLRAAVDAEERPQNEAGLA